MSCRLSSPIMSATPNAYWRTCSMRCNHTRIRLAVMHRILLSSLCLEQTLTSSQSTAWALQETADRSNVCGRSECAETTATITHLHSVHPPTQKDGVMERRNPTDIRGHEKATPSTSHRSKVPCAQHTRTAATRGTGRIQVNTAVLQFSLLRRIGTHTHSEARRTPSAPSECTQQAGAQSPSCHRNGNTKNHRRGPSMLLAGRKANGGMSTARPAEGHSTGNRDTQ
ncbi:hypothetical protein TcCL_ESM08054 [Trypanosoma cruzi]|nr:hypothetical protein TcCL_ESM08054 [Trypanosoma cruzi]